MQFPTALLTLLLLSSCSKEDRHSVLHIAPHGQEFSSPAASVCQPIGHIYYIEDGDTISINSIGHLHNTLLTKIHAHSFNFRPSSSIGYYDTITNYMAAAILTTDFVSPIFNGFDYIPSHAEATRWTSLALADSSFLTEPDALAALIPFAKTLVMSIDTSALVPNGKALLMSLLDDMVDGTFDLDAYIISTGSLDHELSEFICKAVLSVASASFCYWETKFESELHPRLVPWLIAMGVRDCLGAIGATWWSVGSDIARGRETNRGDLMWNILGGAVMSSIGF